MVHILELKGRLVLTNSWGGIDLLHICVAEAQEVVTFSILQLIIGILNGSMLLFIMALAILRDPGQKVLLRAMDILWPQTKHLQKLLVLQDLTIALTGNLWAPPMVYTGLSLEGDHQLKEVILMVCIQEYQPEEILLLIGLGLEDIHKGLIGASEMNISGIFLMTAQNILVACRIV